MYDILFLVITHQKWNFIGIICQIKIMIWKLCWIDALVIATANQFFFFFWEELPTNLTGE